MDTTLRNQQTLSSSQLSLEEDNTEQPTYTNGVNINLNTSTPTLTSSAYITSAALENGLATAKCSMSKLPLPSEAALTAAAHPTSQRNGSGKHSAIAKSVMGNPKAAVFTGRDSMLAPPTTAMPTASVSAANTIGTPMRSSDTPISTAPSSPRLHATTLNIPGVTKSKVSLDGRIPNRDIGAKLLIVMVGLPARGKSYITKKLSRYINWMQYNVQVFNVGNRRRIAAKDPMPDTPPADQSDVVHGAATILSRIQQSNVESSPKKPARGTGLLNAGQISPPKLTLTHGSDSGSRPSSKSEQRPAVDKVDTDNDDQDENKEHGQEGMSQSAEFFDPSNRKASRIREKVAMETLDEALKYLIEGDGNVAILDATNSTQDRRKAIVDRVNEVSSSQLQILFIESVCEDEKILEANMRLKLSGPDYKDVNPEKAYADFKKRVQMYEGAYTPIGEYEEKMGWQYIKLIDVGRKFVAHGTRGFLANHTAYYLMNFNLAPRQIWITRHGESLDNERERIGGDAELTAKGKKYAEALATFIDYQRKLFHAHLLDQHAATQNGKPRAGDITPPNPESSDHFIDNNDGEGRVPTERNFCVWTSMLKRSIQTAANFNDNEYDVKEWRILDELNAGIADGMTYDEIRTKFPEEWQLRRENKLEYRYPGPGGESYMDVIHRLKEVIVEVERMTDHVILVGHRVVARVLLAYFMGLDRDKVADLHIPIGHLFVLEPKPYGVDFKAYEYNSRDGGFEYMPDYKLVKTAKEKAEYERAEREMCEFRKAERQKSA